MATVSFPGGRSVSLSAESSPRVLFLRAIWETFTLVSNVSLLTRGTTPVSMDRLRAITTRIWQGPSHSPDSRTLLYCPSLGLFVATGTAMAITMTIADLHVYGRRIHRHTPDTELITPVSVRLSTTLSLYQRLFHSLPSVHPSIRFPTVLSSRYRSAQRDCSSTSFLRAYSQTHCKRARSYLTSQ